MVVDLARPGFVTTSILLPLIVLFFSLSPLYTDLDENRCHGMVGKLLAEK